jgi:hypothetical protein
VRTRRRDVSLLRAEWQRSVLAQAEAHRGVKRTAAGGRRGTRTCVRDLAGLGLHPLSALATGIMKMIEAATAELPNVGLDDALAILVVLAADKRPAL